MAIRGLGALTPVRTRVQFIFASNESYACAGFSSGDFTRSKAKSRVYSNDEQFYISNPTGATQADTATLQITVIHNNLLNRLKTAYNNAESFTVIYSDKENPDFIKRIEGELSTDVFQTSIEESDTPTITITVTGKMTETFPNVDLTQTQ